MLERFTAQAREVVVLAHQESRVLGHGCIGCEHILLALVHEERGLVARMFKSLGVTVERVRMRVVRSVGPGAEVTSREIRFTPQAKKVLELSLHESLSLGHHSVSSLHLLLALLHQDEGLVTRTLSILEVEAEQLARAAEEAGCGSGPVASRRPAHLARFARAQIEKQAAIKARDFERAAALDTRSRMILSLMPKGTEKSGNRVVARFRALLG